MTGDETRGEAEAGPLADLRAARDAVNASGGMKPDTEYRAPVAEPADDRRCTGCGETLLYCATEGDGEDSGADCCDACDHGLTNACCEHGLQWHHAERGCGYHGFAADQRCGCLLTFDEALARRDAARDRARDAEADPHWYLSTACLHDTHPSCRVTCKFCDAPCICTCHEEETP